MKWAILLLLLVLLPACSKMESIDLEFEQYKYRQTCFGDQTVKCRDMMIDLAIAIQKVGLSKVKNNKDKIIACQGESSYEMGVGLVEEKIDYLDSIRPGFFFRVFLSEMSIEFNPPPFKRERELHEFSRSHRSCKQ